MRTSLENANRLFRAGQYKEALDYYRMAQEKYPFSGTIRFQIDLCMKRLDGNASKRTESKRNLTNLRDLACANCVMLVISFELNCNVYIYDGYEKIEFEGNGPVGFVNKIDISAKSSFDTLEALISKNDVKFFVFINEVKEINKLVPELKNILAAGIGNEVNHLLLVGQPVESLEDPIQMPSVTFWNPDASATKNVSTDLEISATQLVEMHADIFSLKKKLANMKCSDNQNCSRWRPTPALAFNNVQSFIDQCLSNPYILNLAHRTDRKSKAEYAFKPLGVEPIFINGVYGKESDIASAILMNHNCDTAILAEKGEFKYPYEIELYVKYKKSEDRQRHYMAKHGKILTLGSVGYMLSYKKALIQSLCNTTNSNYCAIFDDDVVLHKGWYSIIEKVIHELPKNFMVLSLGAIQYNWSPNILNKCGSSLYQCFGTSIASHATIYRKDVVMRILNEIEKMQLPFDIGALHYLKKNYFSESYVVYPNLFIQDSSESDIADTVQQLKIGISQNNVYRWNLNDYDWEQANVERKMA